MDLNLSLETLELQSDIEARTPGPETSTPVVTPMILSSRHEQFFKSHIVVGAPDECWPWTGRGDKNGYGQFSVFGVAGYRAHRLALALYEGLSELPPIDTLALHSCDNPPCCNPAHLRWGNASDNACDRRDRGRARNQDGEDASGCCKTSLTAQQVMEIRSRYAAGGITQQQLSDEYPITREGIGRIVRHQAWKLVP